MINSYRDLEVFKLAKSVDNDIYKITIQFPQLEQYSLGDQIRRSAHSIPSNIAEGYGRKIYPLEFKRFLVFAQASCDESRVHLETAFERNYITKTEFHRLDDELDHIGRMLFKLSNTL